MSDIDRNLDPLTGLFISQAFMGLIREADRQPDGSLPVPVRFMLDDFANLQIPQIDNVLSIIRSRNIWATLLLQSTNQLDALYGEARARSIMGNCDTHLVLAFQDPESARVFSDRANALPSTLMATPIDRSWLFVRGRTPEQVERFRLEDHPLYGSCPRRSEAMRRPSSRRRALAARDAPAKILKGRAPRGHGKAKGPASDGIRAPGYKARCVNSSDYLRCAR